jgi:hypothetical protein
MRLNLVDYEVLFEQGNLAQILISKLWKLAGGVENSCDLMLV